MGIGCCCKKTDENQIDVVQTINTDRIHLSTLVENLIVDENKAFSSILQQEVIENIVEKAEPGPDMPLCAQKMILKSIVKPVLGQKLKPDPALELKVDVNYKNGLYTGQYSNEQRSGLGIFKLNQGSFYSGQWSSDKPDGLGYMLINEFTSYEGNFKKGLYEGYGQYIKHNDFYNGDWKKGLQHGKGEEKIDHFEYKGYFKKGKKHGKGTLKCSYGEFDGEFIDGNFVEGKIIRNDGVVYKGQWENCKLKECEVFMENSFSISISSKRGLDKGLLKFPDGSFVETIIVCKSGSLELVIKN